MKQSIVLKTTREIRRMREVGEILAEIVEELATKVKAGSSPKQIDNYAEKLCKKYNVNPSCKGYSGYPSATCIGINSQTVHCIPTEKKIKEGDIVTLDMVIDKDGWFADHAVTLGVGKIDSKAMDLIETTKEALYNAIEVAKPGNTIGDIGAMIENTAKSAGFDVLKEMVGHGIGRQMHEEPVVPCFGNPGTGEVITEGMVFTIEPMITEYGSRIRIESDGWSTRTEDSGRFAMFEHTVALTQDGVEILTKK